MKLKVIKNYLKPKVFTKIRDAIFGADFPWFFQKNVTYVNRKETNTFAFTHMFYVDKEPLGTAPLYSSEYNIIKPLLDTIKMKTLIRAKVNFYPNHGHQYTHPPHTDFSYKHKGCLYSLNTTNGYTQFPDGTKIIGKENQAMFFDSSKPHQSATPTDEKCRVNININYL